MFTTNSLQKLSFYDDILHVAQNCMSTNRTAIVLGPTRSGGSILGQWLVQTIAKTEAEKPITGLYHQIGWEGGYFTLMGSLLRRVSPKLTDMKNRDEVATILIDSLKELNCRLLYIDEADRLSAEALRELFRIQDLAARADFPFGIILFGHRQPEEWDSYSEMRGGKVRYHRMIPQIGVEEIAAILEQWCQQLSSISQKFDSNDRRVRGAAVLIEENGGNRIGVLEDFAVMLNGEFKKAKYGASLIKAIIDHADSPKRQIVPRIEQLEMALE